MNKKEALVSIVIPCYNHENYVQETIQSVIEQDYGNIELIIIDDGSSDSSVIQIEKMTEACLQRFKRFEFRHRENKGLCNTLNEALEWCEGEFFAPVASDDILLSYKTKAQVEYLQSNPNTIGVFGGVEVLNGESLSKEVFNNAKYSFNDILLHRHSLPAPTQLLRLNKVRQVGGFNKDLIIEDWSMWLSLTENGGTLDYQSLVFAKYRRHGENISANFEVMLQGRRQLLSIYKNSHLYRQACSRAALIGAREVMAISKMYCINLLYYSFKTYPLSIFTRSYIGVIAELIGLKKR